MAHLDGESVADAAGGSPSGAGLRRDIASIVESLRVIAKSFYFSAEYASRNRSDSQFLEDLYQTFFQRASDPDGKAFWQSQLDGGLDREALILGFMFSQEFQTFMDAVLGTFDQRPETALTMDTYRAAFTRLPDSGGLDFWRGTLRTGQCNGTTYAASNYLINSFFGSAEYAGRGRTSKQFVADLYDVFFRRSPDVGGFNFWANEIDTGSRTRQDVINGFFSSQEWANRVNAIAGAGCVQ